MSLEASAPAAKAFRSVTVTRTLPAPAPAQVCSMAMPPARA
jgi:hypothetical protein